jgi:hypothetical protein
MLESNTTTAKRGALQVDGPIVDLHQVAALAGLNYHAYLRSIRTNPKHPVPISHGRRQLFRRAEIEEFLQVKTAVEA